jgi:sensor histidine kinase regulating citrate/malate metabolism
MKTIIKLACVLGLAIAALFIYRHYPQTSLAEAYTSVTESVAKRTSVQLKLQLNTIKSSMEQLAQDPAILTQGTAGCNKKLDALYKNLQKQMSNINVADSKSLVMCSVNRQRVGQILPKTDEFIKEIFINPEPKEVLSRIYTISPSGRSVVSLYAPIFDNSGKIAGAVGGAIYLNELREKYFRGLPFAQNGYVVLLDDNGDILHHPEAKLIGKNFWSDEVQRLFQKSKEIKNSVSLAQNSFPSTARYTFENQKKVATFEPVNILSGRRWIVIAAIPISE